ncbi:hypothetical protein ACE6JH_25570 [Streptomyces nigra]
MLAPLAATETVRLMAEVPRPLAAELAEGLPPGTAQIIDLDAPEWADPDVLVRFAQAALNPEFGAPELPFTVDPAVRLALGAAMGRRAGSPLVVQLAVNCVLMAPEGFDPADERFLPTSVGAALDLHARRLGTDSQTLRMLLAPLALAEAEGIPVQLWARLASAVAGHDMSPAIAGACCWRGRSCSRSPRRRGPREWVRLTRGARCCACCIRRSPRRSAPGCRTSPPPRRRSRCPCWRPCRSRTGARPTRTSATTSPATRWRRGCCPNS